MMKFIDCKKIQRADRTKDAHEMWRSRVETCETFGENEGKTSNGIAQWKKRKSNGTAKTTQPNVPHEPPSTTPVSGLGMRLRENN